jgi:hypothetical protein
MRLLDRKLCVSIIFVCALLMFGITSTSEVASGQALCGVPSGAPGTLLPWSCNAIPCPYDSSSVCVFQSCGTGACGPGGGGINFCVLQQFSCHCGFTGCSCLCA